MGFKLIEEASSLINQEHYDILYKANEMLMNEMSVIPIYHYGDSMLVSESLRGWNRSLYGVIDFSEAFIQE